MGSHKRKREDDDEELIPAPFHRLRRKCSAQGPFWTAREKHRAHYTLSHIIVLSFPPDERSRP